MKYNFELAEKILEAIESFPPRNDGRVLIEGYSQEEISYHIKKLHEDGLVKGKNAETFGNMEWLATDLTNAGHLFLNKNQKAKMETDSAVNNDMEKQIDTKKVFVVYGRNSGARKAMFTFLRSIGLHPLDWNELIRETGKTSPYVGEILEVGFSKAQAALILFTPDDEAKLSEEFLSPDDEDFERFLTPQPRQNVLYEAGMAMGMFPERTVIVEFGKLRPISDLIGRHVIRMNDSIPRRQELATRLHIAKCDVNLINTDWHTEGDFTTVIEEIKKKSVLNELSANHLPVIKTNKTLVPSFELFKEVHAGNQNEQYKLRIKVKNEGNKPIRDYRFETFFPNGFLNQSTMHAAEVTERFTKTHRFYRTTQADRRNTVLYPQDEISAFSIDYFVNNELRNSELNKREVKFQIFVDDNLIWTFEKEMSELIHNDVNEIQQKLNEEVKEASKT